MNNREKGLISERETLPQRGTKDVKSFRADYSVTLITAKGITCGF